MLPLPSQGPVGQCWVCHPALCRFVFAPLPETATGGARPHWLPSALEDTLGQMFGSVWGWPSSWHSWGSDMWPGSGCCGVCHSGCTTSLVGFGCASVDVGASQVLLSTVVVVGGSTFGPIVPA